MVNCLDWRESPSNDTIRAPAHNFLQSFPVFSPYVAFHGIRCNLLKQVTNPPKVESHKTSFNIVAPSLIISTTHNPAAPHEWAKGIAIYTAGSRLITLKGEGHTGYGRRAACVDEAINGYQLTGTTQAKA